jgi:hypothetical protein
MSLAGRHRAGWHLAQRDNTLQLSSLYASAEHPDGAVDRTKAGAAAAEGQRSSG